MKQLLNHPAKSMRSSSIRKTLAKSTAALAGIALCATPALALAAESDVLSDPVNFDHGHTDIFNPILENGNVRLVLKEDITGHNVIRDPESVTLTVNSAAYTTKTSSLTPFNQPTYYLPQVQKDNLLWPGFDSNGVSSLDFESVSYNFKEVTGPGKIFLSLSADFGERRAIINDGSFEVTNGKAHIHDYARHEHVEWAFTKPGTYNMIMNVTVHTRDGRTLTSNNANYTWHVIPSENDPNSVSEPEPTETPSASTEPTDSNTPTAAPEDPTVNPGDTQPDPDSPADTDDSTDDSSSTGENPDDSATGDTSNSEDDTTSSDTSVENPGSVTPVTPQPEDSENNNSGQPAGDSSNTDSSVSPAPSPSGDSNSEASNTPNSSDNNLSYLLGSLLLDSDTTTSPSITPNNDNANTDANTNSNLGSDINKPADQSTSNTNNPALTCKSVTEYTEVPAPKAGTSKVTSTSTRVGGSYTINRNTHVHPNWIFTAPGTYHVHITQTATIKNGQKITAPTNLTFKVGGAGNANSGHFDIGAIVENGKIIARVKDDRNQPASWVSPSSLVFGLGSASQATAPAGIEFIAHSGQKVWMIGQTQVSGVPWVGANTMHESLLSQTTGTVTWTLNSVSGPGALGVFTSGTFGKIVGTVWFGGAQTSTRTVENQSTPDALAKANGLVYKDGKFYQPKLVFKTADGKPCTPNQKDKSEAEAQFNKTFAKSLNQNSGGTSGSNLATTGSDTLAGGVLSGLLLIVGGGLALAIRARKQI